MNTGEKPRALIAMSGGVDSSVAALLTMRAGYECVGVTMKLYAEAEDAERVADLLGIRHLTIDFSDGFRKFVVEPFVASYGAGETPNPCILCNNHIKFGMLYDYARENGFDKLVTGHYARIEEGADGSLRLMRAADFVKDQSYFLYGLTPEKLEHLLFPLGDLTKHEVRVIAAEAGFENADARESQDICFISDGGYADFIASYRTGPSKAGNFVDGEGRVLGRHCGIERYTIGQRRGLGIAVGHPIFVKEIRPDTGDIVLADEHDLFASHIEIADVNLVSEMPGRAEVMIRYNAKPSRAKLQLSEAGTIIAEFDNPVRAPAKGQAAVLYDGNYIIGGGMISGTRQRGRT